MKKINYEDCFSAVVDFLKDEIAGMVDVNPKHIDIVSIEVNGFDEFYENGDIATNRKVVWRNRDWVDGEAVYGEEHASLWVSIEYGDNGVEAHDDVVYFDYDKAMEE